MIYDTINLVVSRWQLILLTVGNFVSHKSDFEKMVMFACYRFNNLSWPQKIDIIIIITMYYIIISAFEIDKELAKF